MRPSLKLAGAFLAGVYAAELARELAPLLRRSRGADDLRPGSTLRSAQSGRGRHAHHPGEIPARGWKDILIRTFKEFNEDQIPMIAAGVTFYTLLALFPGIGAFVALYGLFADVADAQRHVAAMSAILPGGAITLIGDQLLRAAAAHQGGLSLAFLAGLVLALWSANGAMKAIITGLNIAYDETDRRGFFGKILVPLAFTLSFLVFALSAISLAALGSTIEDRFGRTAGGIYSVLYWVGLFVAFTFGLTLLYRFGPSRRRVRWRWISWGSGAAAVAWLVMSGGFSFYVANFGSYDRSYGALGAVVGFMTWTWLSSMVLLLGAELNSEIEHQTARDTTIGAPKPLGARGAVMADTVGAAQ